MFGINDSQVSFLNRIGDAPVASNDLTLKPLSDQPFDLLLHLDLNERLQQQADPPPHNAFEEDSNDRQPTTTPLSPHQEESSVWDSEADLDDAPSDNSRVEEDIWTSHHLEPQTMNTLSWDTRNPHFPTYEQKKLAQKNVGTPFLTEAPISFFEPLIDRLNNTSISSGPITPIPSTTAVNTSTKVIYEISLVKALLQAMEGISSTYFYWDNNDTLKLRLNQSIRILGVSRSAIEPMIEDILMFSTQLRALERVATTCKTQPEKYGLTGMAFGCCLAELHLNIQYSIMNTFAETPADYYRLSIIKVHQYIHHLSTVVKMLYSELCNCQSADFSIPFGAQLLNLLHTQVQKFDLALTGSLAFYKQICLVILKYTSVPYLHMLSKWLHLSNGASLDIQWDPYNEFFIQQQSPTFDNDEFHQFQIRPDIILPYFIDDKLGQYILRSGISQRILKKITPEHPLFHLEELFCLRHILSNSDYSKYRNELDRVCQSIYSYNKNGVMAMDEYDPAITSDAHLNQQNTEENVMETSSVNDPPNYDTPMLEIPNLPLLNKNIDLSSDFLNTLNNLIAEQQQYRSETNDNTTKIFKYAHVYMPTLETMTQQSYIQPLKQWCSLSNESFILSFLKQYKLQYHLSLISGVFLLKNGTFAAGLKMIFFPTQDRIRLDYKGNKWPPKAVELNMALRNLLLENRTDKNLEEEEEDLVNFTVRTLSNAATCRWMDPQAVEALDFLKVNYCAKYPLNMVITPIIINKYNRIFTFLVRLLRTGTVTKCCYGVLRKQTWRDLQTRIKVSQICFQLDQFMNALQGYVHGTVIENTWKSFERNVSTMIQKQQQQDGSTTSADVNSQQSILTTDYTLMIMEPYGFRDYHEHILDRMLIQCFLKTNQKRIMNVLRAILQDVISFGTAVDDYQRTATKRRDALDSLEKKFVVKCENIFMQFQTNVKLFVKILNMMDSKGSGSLANILCHDDSSGSDTKAASHAFTELYCKNEAKEGLDNFVTDLLVRIGFNNFYDRLTKDE